MLVPPHLPAHQSSTPTRCPLPRRRPSLAHPVPTPPSPGCRRVDVTCVPVTPGGQAVCGHGQRRRGTPSQTGA